MRRRGARHGPRWRQLAGLDETALTGAPGGFALISPQDLRTVGALSTLGLSFVLAIVIGTAAGWWLDQWLATKPLFFFVGFLFGLAAGVLNVVRIGRRAIK